MGTLEIEKVKSHGGCRMIIIFESMNMRLKFLLFCSLLSFTQLFAQKVVTVEGTYLYVVPETVSLKEAKEKALYSAQVQAMADEFGTVISRHSLFVSDSQHDNFYVEGDGTVKGEWIETIGTPVYECGFHNDELYVRCTVKGKARELKVAKVELEIDVLRNGFTPEMSSTDFKSGDKVYLKFKAPVDGYVAVYLHDKVNDEVMSLLPYKLDRIAALKINADEDYIFFSKKHNTYGLKVHEYTLRCESDLDVNTLYVVFSTSELSKPSLLTEEDRSALNHLNFEKFNSWIAKSQTYDSNMQVEKYVISISNK